ncbi:hypothetical protein E2562_008510 [Oryza meyeriana var. granulata]|uniref:Uncharacterized protein n=1 Tax=Oryza meyeriana var. granulata TaxID=110450 RepID=A0A6G1EJS9_9ORYZ|nr:hypothetical protein E2562_008510 [Oryza meyeriana var. granulata]
MENARFSTPDSATASGTGTEGCGDTFFSRHTRPCSAGKGHAGSTVTTRTLLSGIQAEVNHMRQTAKLVSNERQKLLDKAATAEKRFEKGWNTLREEGRAIQSELNQISDIEKQAVGLKSILDQLPRGHASEFRSEISGLASQVKKEKRVLNNTLSKIVNYGVPI